MATNLRKFVNLKFLKTCDLRLLQRLLVRYSADRGNIDLSAFDGPKDDARDRLRKFFEGPESGYPAALKSDLHRIAALGTRHGMRLLLERARAAQVAVGPAPGSKEDAKADPKYVALLLFLDHQNIFDAASDLLALETTLALTELRGASAELKPKLDRKTKAAFEAAARRFLSSEKMGSYCRIGWYDDGDEVQVVAVHGAEIATEWVVENEKEEKVISFRPLGTTVLSYDPVEGRLKVGGLPKAQRGPFADLFAATMLGEPTFFRREGARDLYTLDPVEKAGFAFRLDHEFDPAIKNVKIVEVQADRSATSNGRESTLWSVLIKDRANALERMGQVSKVALGNGYQLEHITFRVEFDSDVKPHPRVTVKVAPPETAAFKREMYEGRIMTLLRRNGLCLDRKPDDIAVAAE